MRKIYYSHPKELYGSDIEKIDLDFLSSKGDVTNPRGYNERDMIFYIKLLKEHDVVYYRCLGFGVSFEVLSALAFEIPVYSLETKRSISKSQIKGVVEVFKSSPHFKKDVKAFETNFPEFYDEFLRITGNA